MARRRLPPLKALPAFEQAARHLSFSAAARELNLTHGAISRQMKSLETHLGVRLFRRLNRRIELTDAGAAFLPAARTALDVVEASAARLVGGDAAGAVGRLLPADLHDALADPAAVRLQRPASGDRRAPVGVVGAGRLRARRRRCRDPHRRRAVARGHRGACLHERGDRPGLQPRAGRAAAGCASPPTCGHHTLLHTETRADAWTDWLARSKTATIDASKGQRFEHFYFLLEAAVAGLGVAVAPRPLVMEDLKLGRLVAPFGFVRSGRQYCLLYPAELADLAKVRTFRSWIDKARRRYS